MTLYKLNLQLFAGEVQTTDRSELSPTMKTYYKTDLIELAEAKLVHDQFGTKKPIPPNEGKTIEFRMFDSLPKAMTPLTEGVTPDGNNLSMSSMTATVAQYGDYVRVSDVLDMTAVDPIIVQATKKLGSHRPYPGYRDPGRDHRRYQRNLCAQGGQRRRYHRGDQPQGPGRYLQAHP